MKKSLLFFAVFGLLGCSHKEDTPSYGLTQAWINDQPASKYYEQFYQSEVDDCASNNLRHRFLVGSYDYKIGSQYYVLDFKIKMSAKTYEAKISLSELDINNLPQREFLKDSLITGDLHQAGVDLELQGLGLSEAYGSNERPGLLLRFQGIEDSLPALKDQQVLLFPSDVAFSDEEKLQACGMNH